MSDFLAVSGTCEIRHDEWSGSRQIPTFYLNRSVQGILTEDHARRVAIDVLTSWAGDLLDVNDDVEVIWHLTIVSVD